MDWNGSGLGWHVRNNFSCGRERAKKGNASLCAVWLVLLLLAVNFIFILKLGYLTG
jgi:hypothetical protein